MKAILLGLLVLGAVASTALLFKPVRRYLSSFFVRRAPEAPPFVPPVPSSGIGHQPGLAVNLQVPVATVPIAPAVGNYQPPLQNNYPQIREAIKHNKVIKAINAINARVDAAWVGGLDTLYLHCSSQTGDKPLTSLDSVMDHILGANQSRPIKTLCLSRHKITQIPDAICGLRALEELDLSYNLIKNFSAPFIAFIKGHESLQRIKLRGCPIEQDSLDALEEAVQVCNAERNGNGKPGIKIIVGAPESTIQRQRALLSKFHTYRTSLERGLNLQ